MRTTFGLAVLSSIILAAPAAARDNTIFSDSANPLTMAVYGDAPYGTNPADTAEFQATPAFVASVNEDEDVRLVLHVGDIHSGKQSCTQAYDGSIFDLWTQYRDPLVYTPGDNEWTDCHKTGEGGNVLSGGQPVDYANGNPVANLALVRSIFFPDPGHALGQRDKVVLSQVDAYDPAHPGDAAFVENVMWEQSRTLFVTVKLPGGSNDDTDPWYGVTPVTQGQLDERAARDGADLRWLDKAFSVAQSDPKIRAVVIGLQADMWDPENGAAYQSQYEPYVAKIAAGTEAFGGPVLLLERRLARLPVGRSAAAVRPQLLHPPRLRRAELPPDRRPRQHFPAGVAEAPDRPPGEPPHHRHHVRPVQLDPRDPAAAVR